MTELFRRQTILEIGNRRIESRVEEGKVHGLDFEFNVERSLTPTPNKARIQIYNLTKDERADLQSQVGVVKKVTRAPRLARDVAGTTALGLSAAVASPFSSETIAQAGVRSATFVETSFNSLPVRLHAGYLSAKPTLIFSGDLRDVNSEKQGPDVITTIESGDGERAFKKSRAKRSFGPATRVETVIRFLVRTMGLKIANEDAISGARFEQVGQSYPKGVTVSGRAAFELERVATACGLEYSIQDGSVLFLRRGQAASGEAFILNSGTGLLEAPEKGKKGIVKAKTLIIPGMVPGRKVRFDDEDIRGFFRIWKATYTGSTFGNQYFADIDCKEV